MPKPKLNPEPQNAGPRLATEPERVLSNVAHNLRDECGFNELQAESMADAGVDWHEAKALIDAGCPHETAVLLLMPDE